MSKMLTDPENIAELARKCPPYVTEFMLAVGEAAAKHGILGFYLIAVDPGEQLHAVAASDEPKILSALCWMDQALAATAKEATARAKAKLS